jgi:hypothetical protein
VTRVEGQVRQVQLDTSKLVDTDTMGLDFADTVSPLASPEVAVKTLDKVFREYMANQSILLVQPEHILLSKLMGPECYISDNEKIGRQLINTRKSLDEHSRDIVVESDEM